MLANAEADDISAKTSSSGSDILSNHAEPDEVSAKTSSSGSENHSNNDNTSSSGSRATEDSSEAIKEQISKKETQAVFRLRLLVILVLLGAAAAVSFVVYHITSDAQISEFRIQYDGVAEKILQSFGNIIVEMGAISGLAVAASAHSVDHHSEWPFVTVSDFQQRASNARTLSQSLFVSLNPVVTNEQLPRWEEYVLSQNNYWM